MSGSQTAEVYTYTRKEKFGVLLPHPSTCKQAMVAIAGKFGLKQQSLALFRLSIGPLGCPNKTLSDRDVVPVGASFCFHRWSFDVVKETKLCKQDEVAMHFIFCEARHNYENNPNIKPTPEQVHELEEFLDPLFTVERQFVELMRTVQGYFTYVVPECTVKSDIVCNACNVPKGTQIQCHLNTQTLAFFAVGGKLVLEWDWKIVRRWKMDAGNTIMFEVCLEDRNAPILKWVSLETRQSGHLFCLAGDICDFILKDASQLPPINPALAGRVQDPLAEVVNKIFKGYAPKFSSLEKCGK